MHRSDEYEKCEISVFSTASQEDWEQYETEKRIIKNLILSPAEYEDMIAEIKHRLEI